MITEGNIEHRRRYKGSQPLTKAVGANDLIFAVRLHLPFLAKKLNSNRFWYLKMPFGAIYTYRKW